MVPVFTNGYNFFDVLTYSSFRKVLVNNEFLVGLSMCWIRPDDSRVVIRFDVLSLVLWGWDIIQGQQLNKCHDV